MENRDYPSLISKSEALYVLISAILFLGSLFVVSQGRIPDTNRFFALILLIVMESLPVAGWILAAFGLGWGLLKWIFPLHVFSIVFRFAMGAGLTMMLDWGLGSLGLLNFWSAWGIGCLGWAILLVLALPRVRDRSRTSIKCSTAWPSLFLMPSLGLMVGCCLIPPSLLWPSEFDGFDVLEYHLQLPQEWLRSGKITGLEHNIYSYLPDGVESIYLHLGIWKHGVVEASYACQLLHMTMALISALLLGELLGIFLKESEQKEDARREVQCAGAAIYFSIPWVLVTGSMAYTEQAMMAFALAAALCLLKSCSLEDNKSIHLKFCGLGGLLSGFSILSKPTAAGILVVPTILAGILLMANRKKSWILSSATIGIGVGVVLSCFLIRNFIWTGNPAFPFLAGWFGTGHWTAAQAAQWNQAHSSSLPLLQRISALFSSGQGLFHPQFSLLFWPAVFSGLLFLFTRRMMVRTAGLLLGILILQCGFWAGFTHLLSRFLIPVLATGCVILGISLSLLSPRFRKVIISIVTLVSLIQGFEIYLNTRKGLTPAFIDGLSFLMNEAEPTRTLNQLPPGSKIYSEGFATPFYIRPSLTYHTCFDKSPMGEIIGRSGAGAVPGWLRKQGYTHVLIDWWMLNLYWNNRDYGYDRNISLQSLSQVVNQGLQRVEVKNPTDIVLYKVAPSH
jgi:hypothetical protein